jgi:hypothetical protein
MQFRQHGRDVLADRLGRDERLRVTPVEKAVDAITNSGSESPVVVPAVEQASRDYHARVVRGWFLGRCRGSAGVCGRQRLLGQAFDGVAFALAGLRASASSVAVKIVTDSPIKIAPRTSFFRAFVRIKVIIK